MAIDIPVRINMDDVTLGQNDRIETLMASKGISRATATAYIVLRDEDPSVTLMQVKALRQRDIETFDSDDDAGEDDDDAGPDPT